MARFVLRALRPLGGAIAALVTLAGCSPLTLLDVLTARDGYQVERDIAYGALPRQKLDIYRPSDGVDPSRPVVVFFYGGAWKMGERGQYRFIGQSLAKAGFETIVVDYRLYPQVALPGFMADGAAAVAWVAQHVPGAKGRIILVGHSAGAYISAMLACDKHYLEAAGSSRQVLAGFVGMAGPYAFEPDGENALILAAAPNHPNMPIDAVDGGEPPAFLIYAEGDDVVWPRNSERLAARMKAAGDQVTLKGYTGLDHARLIGVLGTTLGFTASVRSDVIDWLKQH